MTSNGQRRAIRQAFKILKKYLAIIPARFCSKGIPFKNLLKIEGLSLVERAIKSAVNSKNNLDIVLSSDSEEILREANKYNDVIKHIRKPEHASDSATTAIVVKDIIHEINKDYHEIIVLQPTSPFRTADHIDHAINSLVMNPDCDGLVSVSKEEKDILKSFYINKNGYLKGTYSDEAPFAPRQSLPDVYRANGAIFIVKTSIVKTKSKLYGVKMIPFEMDQSSSIDIDSIDDLKNLNYELYVPK